MADKLTQLRKGVLEFAVLALLEQSSRYGVEIIENLNQYPGLSTKAGTIYPLLTRLKTLGLVTTSWQESPVGPPRKYYALSHTGKKRYHEMKHEWSQLVADMASVMCKPDHDS